MAQNKKYDTAAKLSKGVEAYFDSISYQRSVEVESTTGKRKMMVTEWLDKPGLAGLCLFLGISKETWSNYAKDEELRCVTERATLKLEKYWQDRLDGKGAHGARFVLTNCFGNNGWREKVEVDQKSVGMTLEEYLENAEREGKGQCF